MIDPTLADEPAGPGLRCRYRTRATRPLEDRPFVGPEWFTPARRFEATFDRGLTDGAARCLDAILRLMGAQAGASKYKRDVTFAIGWMAAGLGRCSRSVRNYLNEMRDAGYLLAWGREGRRVRVLLSSKVIPEVAIRMLSAASDARERNRLAAKARREARWAAQKDWRFCGAMPKVREFLDAYLGSRKTASPDPKSKSP